MERPVIDVFRGIGWRVARALGLGGLVMWLHPRSALRTTGWLRTFESAQPMNRNGDPIPWFTYPAVDFLLRADLSGLRVFEYGSGASTLFFARKVGEILSVDHDDMWSRRVAKRISPPHQVICRPRGDLYTREIEKHGKFDIVVIDGVDRAQCALVALKCLTPEGVMIWDDAARADFRESLPQLLATGYQPLFFVGMAPISFLACETAVLYKRGHNCLGI